jgi:GDP-mannose 6-dehydrogenase
MVPEFLREGTGVDDFFDPPFVVVGTESPETLEAMTDLFRFLDRPVRAVGLGTAEGLKYACNAFHAAKISFANEMGRVLAPHGVDAREVMEVFCEDTKLNLSPYYLRPGFAYGGSCLPKDLRSLQYLARQEDLDVPLLSGTGQSNELVIRQVVDWVIAQDSRRVALLGLSFKSNTDDLRESPNVELAERLIGKGYDLRVYDKNVSLAAIHGANRDFILNKIPHIHRLMVPTIEEVLAHAQTVVIGNAAPEFADVPRRVGEGQTIIDFVREVGEGQTIIDFVRVCDSRTILGVYEGLCW